MNLGEFTTKRKTSTLVVTVLVVLGGVFSYFDIGRLEDPEFTLKDAVVVTAYPGATAEEVEREVTDLIERAAQQLGDLKEVKSTSQPGLSTVQATMVNSSSAEKLPRIWNELRNKVGDVQSELPPGAMPSVVRDDFSDVYGVFLAITGQGYSDMVKGYRPVLHEVPARNLGIEVSAVSSILQAAFDGSIIGIYRERDELIPILMRAPKEERVKGVPEVRNLWIWSPIAEQNIPLQQVISGYETVFEDSRIMRFNRTRSILVQGASVNGWASSAVARIKDDIEAIEMPEGYTFIWDGEVKLSRLAKDSLLASFPFFVLLMVLISIFLFDALRPPLIIWLCVPLAVIGVVGGLLATGQPFNFVALLGLLSLTGMLIKNAIVLMDPIDIEIHAGKPKFEAVVDSGVSRMRPVMMAAMTTVLGMATLLFDAFFKAMAVTIMAGLTFATILTLVVVPVLYTMFYKVKPAPQAAASSAVTQSVTLAKEEG